MNYSLHDKNDTVAATARLEAVVPVSGHSPTHLQVSLCSVDEMGRRR